MDTVQIKPSKLDKIISNARNCKCDCIKENMENLKNCITLEKTIEASYTNVTELKEDIENSFYNSLCSCQKKYEETCKEHDVYYTNEMHKMHRLTPINEQNEDCRDSLTDLCYHGCKNGCSAHVPTPQEVSEKVFKESWLQKLQDIKQKETVLRNKEITLQNRERALFKKEREIQTLECLWKHKLKQLDLYFKQNKDLQHLLKECNTQNDNLESTSNTDSSEKGNEESCTNDNCIEKLDGIDINKRKICAQNIPVPHVLCNQAEQLDKHTDNTEIICNDYHQEKVNTISSCSPVNNASVIKKVKNQSGLRNSIAAKTTYSKSTYKTNNKTKRSSKIDYSDLDTTLSADIGDSSFVQTAQKFNPEMYRKPYMFTRSTSERHIKHVNNKSSLPNLETQNFSNSDNNSEALIGIEQNKILERVTKNIVASRHRSTKFQHYGYMDQNVDSTNKMCKIENEKRYSYLNLETGNKLCSCQNFNKDIKERPISWNEETNEWLQKKRKAYNMMIEKSRTDNKENVECNAKISNKSEKIVKKKDIKNRIFTIFR